LPPEARRVGGELLLNRLRRALSHAVREAAVEPDHRDEERENAKAAEQSGIQARPGIEPPYGPRQI
jgi:hypothetical protein